MTRLTPADVMPYRYADMASIHKQGDKPNYFAAFYDPEGFRRFKSTGTENTRIATTICLAIQNAADLARAGRLSNEKALKLIRETSAGIGETHGPLAANQAQAVLTPILEVFVKLAGGELTAYTVRGWLETWLAGKTDASKATVIEYRRIVDLFTKFLGARANRALSTLQDKQVEEFKAYLGTRVSPSTVNKAVKVLKAAFSNAVKKRQLEFSPAEHTESIEAESAGRRPFTPAEIGALLQASSPEWRTMILVAYYTGLRLRDCASLTWREVDLLEKAVTITTEKTKRKQVIPIHAALEKHLNTLAGDSPDAPLCQSFHGKPASKLSALFYDVMTKAGLVEPRNHQGTGKGRDAKRETQSISFHSLRYNTTSALKSSGVSDSVAMDLVGHETASISRNYTKIDDTAKRQAIDKLPDITTP